RETVALVRGGYVGEERLVNIVHAVESQGEQEDDDDRRYQSGHAAGQRGDGRRHGPGAERGSEREERGREQATDEDERAPAAQPAGPDAIRPGPHQRRDDGPLERFAVPEQAQQQVGAREACQPEGEGEVVEGAEHADAEATAEIGYALPSTHS